MMFRFLLYALTVLASAVHAAKTYTYPDNIKDTSARDVPFFLTVSEITKAAYANKNVQLNYVNSTSKDLGVFIDPVSSVGEFVLKNGSLQVASSTAYYATLQPLPTVQNITRHSFTFVTDEAENSNAWELTNVSDEGVFGLLSKNEKYAQFNGFVICSTNKKYHYQLELQSSSNGENTKGCEPIALHAFMGPPY